MTKSLLIIIFLLFRHICFSQGKDFNALLDSGKAEFEKQELQQFPDYSKAISLLSDAVHFYPENAEARYFLGYALDRYNSRDATNMRSSKKEITLRASEQFEKVNLLQPTYTGQLLILDPYSKLSSIWASLAQGYITSELADSARWAFREGKRRGGFLEPILEFNRQMLNSCKENSILITRGDNVTNSMWYLQTIEHLRQDVTITDVNMLNAGWYVKYLKNKLNLTMSLSDNEIDSTSYSIWDPTVVTIKNPKDTFQSFTWTLKPTYYGRYILKGDLMLLDIIKQNVFTRNIYFAGFSDTTQNLFLMDFIEMDGIVTRINPHKKAHQSSDLTTLFHNLEKYNINHLDSTDLMKSPDVSRLLHVFRWAYYITSYTLFQHGEVRAAGRLLEEMERRFPANILPYISEDFKVSISRLTEAVR